MLNTSFYEGKLRGTADFPLEFHQVNSSHPLYNMPCHWHVEFELLRILEGTLTITVEGKKFVAAEGSTLFIPGGFLHSAIPEGCFYECIVYDPNMLQSENDASRKYIKQIIDHKLAIQNHFNCSYNNIHQAAWSLFDALRTKGTGYQMIVKGGLYQLFGTILSEGHYKESSAQTPQSYKSMTQLKKALEYIEKNYAFSITLEDLANAAGMSRKYFCGFFRKMTHRTPIDYLNWFRVEKACRQLLTADASVTETALNCGFFDLSYFIKTFKKYKHVTPKQYSRV